jgi:hypothetical protein
LTVNKEDYKVMTRFMVEEAMRRKQNIDQEIKMLPLLVPNYREIVL